MFIRTPQDFEARVLPGPNGQGGEEGTHLDFKRAHNRGPEGHRDTALDLAAFANALGGVLVFGVAEDDQRPKFAAQFHPIDVATTVKHVEDAITTWTYGFEERPRPEPMDIGGKASDRNYPINSAPLGRSS